MALRDLILSAADLKPVAEVVPEWGVTVYVRPMSAADRDAWDFEQYEALDAAKAKGDKYGGSRGFRSRLLVRTLCDEAGAAIFGPADIAALDAKSAAVLDRLYVLAQRVNGLGAKEVAALAGESAAAPSGS